MLSQALVKDRTLVDPPKAFVANFKMAYDTP
jgi:hypothetical protein